ncbi:hypothetical protein [Sphingobium bisphenolivorans]|uniref:hypothetical protein n=1 Tax=Sphingobium bisphenolivorans TaxID=1335760 RepID=UPI0003A5991A|nr:hypothetical protein [Sphingobium bisphenolivorans]
MENRLTQIEKAWEQALEDIFQPYVDLKREPTAKAMDAFRAVLGSSRYDIRRHIAETAARQGSTFLSQYLAEEDWRRPNR